MLPDELEMKVRKVIDRYPPSIREQVLYIWEDWLKSTPRAPFYLNWDEFSSRYDDQEALYTDLRVYLKKVTNELKEYEVPPTMRQRISKALAAIVSVILVILLALSRVARASE